MSADDILLCTNQLIGDIRVFLGEHPHSEKYIGQLVEIENEISAPCVLAIAGKVKAGKSFLINALLGVDLAMTGNTETTATVNVFKAGKPFSPDTPVLCQWIDGSKEWKSKDFLDSLQGTEPSILDITSKIDKLIFYIEGNPLLEEITLVDTPGIGADVGEEGDSHQIQTDAYFKLRNRHQSDTVAISNSADAIIYLFNTVPTETDRSFLSALYDGGKGLTALNSVGVLSKVDKEPSVVKNISKFSKEFEKELFTILPTSAALSRYLPDRNAALSLVKSLKNGFTSEKGFSWAMKAESAFIYERLPDCKLSVNERKEILRNFAPSDLPWSAFKIVAQELYYSKDIEKSLTTLSSLSGVQQLRDLINSHFFQRSRLLRCNRNLTDLKRILSYLLYDKRFLNAEYYAKMRPSLLENARLIREPYGTILCNLIEENVADYSDIKSIKTRISAFNNRIDKLLLQLEDINNLYLAFQKVVASPEEFSDTEMNELERLFTGKEINTQFVSSRQRYWAAVANSSAPNSIRQFAAAVAKNRYSQLLF